jgi:hypothetical protein
MRIINATAAYQRARRELLPLRIASGRWAIPVSDPKPWFGRSRALRPADAAAGEGLLRASADLCFDGEPFSHPVQGAGATKPL